MERKKQTSAEIEERLRLQIELKSGIPLTSLTEFDEDHLFALIENKATTLSKIFNESGASRSRARSIVGTGARDHFQKFFIYFGVPEHFVRLLNHNKRYEYLVSSGYGRTLIIDYASRLLEGKEANQTALELAGKLTQLQLKKDNLIKHLLGGHLGKTSALRIDLGLIEGNLSQPTWPQGFLKKCPTAARNAFEQTKAELSVTDLNWKKLTSNCIRENTTYGARLLDKFDNSIHKMVEYFESQSPRNIVKHQNALKAPRVLKEMVINALEAIDKQVIDLPNVSVRKLSESKKLGSYLSALSRLHCKSHPEMMCALFPEQNWHPHDFKISGVPNKYWIDDAGNLNVEAATDAIEFVLKQCFHPNDIDTPEKKLEQLGRLSQVDMNFHGFSVLASPSALANGENWTWPLILKACFPEVVVTRTRIKSAITFIQRLKQHGLIPPDLEPLMYVENRGLKTGVRSYLFDDVHLPIDVNGIKQNIVFELQGPQHANKSHLNFTNSVLENDVKKFLYHCRNKQPIYYVTSDALYKNAYFTELKSQGLDIEKEVMDERDVLLRAKQLEEGCFVAEGFYEKVKKHLMIDAFNL
ncbi:hypothetical protein AB8I92_001006 [Vibrio alginolyticus]